MSYEGFNENGVKNMTNSEQTSRQRMLYIAKILNEETDSEHFLTINQLRSLLLDRYGIDAYRQTITADISALRSTGMQIEEYLGKQKRYWVEHRKFSTAEVKLLIDMVYSSKFITKKKSVELEEKLHSLVSNHEAAGMTRHVSVEHRVKRDNELIYLIIDTINTAINEGKRISFSYFKYDTKKKPVLRNNGQPYVLSPRQLVWNGDYYYVVGVNEDREIRIFRLDRIVDCPKVLDVKSRLFPKGFSMSKFLNTTFRMFGTDYTTVVLYCSNDVVDSIFDRFGKSIKVESVDTNHFRIAVDVAVSNVFYSWVFGFSGKVKIDGPEEVREEYIRMINNAI